MPPSERHIRALKARQTRRDLAEIHKDDGTTLQQLQSPLFGKLPTELRLLIYEFALAGYFEERPSRPFPSTSELKSLGSIFWCLKNLYPPKTDTQLLLTCRLVYSEANGIPMRFAKFKVAVHNYWSSPSPTYFAHFTHKNSAEMQEVEFFHAMVPTSHAFFPYQQFQPKVITLHCQAEGWVEAHDLPPLPSSCCRLNLVREASKSEEQAVRREMEEKAPRRLRTSSDTFELSRDGNETILTTYKGIRAFSSSWCIREIPWSLLERYHKQIHVSMPLEATDWRIITLVYTRHDVVDG